MERTVNNNALHQALAPSQQQHLPSNFAYMTMRRIRLEQQKSERRQRIAAFVVVACFSLLGIGLLVYAFGSVLWKSLVAAFSRPDAFVLVLPTLFCLTFFALLNHWLARHYGSGTA